MPLKRKLVKVGDSRAVIIPADWLKYHEEKTGKTIEDILLEVNKVITISIEDNDESAHPETKSDL